MGVFEFLNRHRNKIMLAGGAVGAVVVINKVLANYEKQWQSSSSKGFVHEAKKKEIHFENIINECNQLCQRMSSTMMNQLQELMDDNHLIENLKQMRNVNNPKEKIEAWKSLRLNMLTRLLSELYCTCILVCYMRVQMSIVGAQVYVQTMNYATQQQESTSSKRADLTHMKAYTKYHALLGSFYEQGFDCLIHPLEEIVEDTVKEYKMDYSITMQDFKVILDNIKRKFSQYLSHPNSKTNVLFLDVANLSSVDLTSVCPDSGKLSDKDEKILRTLLAETQDILEGDDFRHVLDSSIDVGYAVLMDTLIFDAFIKMENNSKDVQSGFFPNGIQAPMVKILPKIRTNYINRTEADKKALVNHLLCLDVLNCFAANVYEAFCVPK